MNRLYRVWNSTPPKENKMAKGNVNWVHAVAFREEGFPKLGLPSWGSP